MRFTPLALAGAWLVEPEPRADERGFFARTRCAREFEEHGLSTTFVQESISFNDVAGTLRGMHYQLPPHDETKLVRCTAGSIYDVAVDVRPESPTRWRWHGEVLSAANRRALYIPQGYAHGFITLEDQTEVLYEISAYYEPGAARGIRWNDPLLSIAWPRQPARISERDASYALLEKPAER
jgi:dTDP-4-dehydrorhamnose 3,5-epimerase